MVLENGTTLIIIDRCEVSPPRGSLPTTTVPLTFFDIPWLLCRPMQRLLFYEFPHSTHHFTNSIFPSLKHSLSLTLRHFFPLAANLIIPPQPNKPHILYTPDSDSIPLTIAECNGSDYKHLIVNNYPRDAKNLHPFVPELLETRVLSDGTRVSPITSMQFTVFPNQSICIGITSYHVAADGLAFHHFMKSWASICSRGDESGILDGSLPVHDKDLIQDPNGIGLVLLREWRSWDEVSNPPDTRPKCELLADKLRATYVMGRAQIDRLKNWVSAQLMKNSTMEPLHLSTFVVICSFIWVCLVKSQESEKSCNFSDNDEMYYFVPVADCRSRLEYHIPSTYFGNCLAICVVAVKRRDLLGENGIIEAAKATGKRIKELGKRAVEGSEKWMLDWKEVSESGHLVTVAGSPRLGAYETDFGWGKPKKYEVVHVDVSGAFSLVDCRDEKGGVEIGLGLSKVDMGRFVAIWEQNLRLV